MRLISILTAAVVGTALYFLVIERDTLLSFAAGEAPDAEVVDAAPAEAQPAAVSELAQNERNLVSVVAERSTAQVIDGAVVLRGRTEAARQVDVRAETSGLVISEPLRKGVRVEQGDLLCRLDIGTRDATLKEAESRLVEAGARLADAEINERAAERLSQDGFAAETRLTAATAAVQSARAGVESAEAGIAAAKKELERLEIRAPFSGVLESDTAEIGAFLQPGNLCATVLQLDPIKLVGFVPEAEVDRIQVGARAGARLTSGRELTGEVTFISRSADPMTRTFRVEVTAPSGDEVRDGQTVEILISSDGATAHKIPQSSLTLDNQGRLGVRLVGDGDITEFAPVSIVRDTSDGVWVTGLDEAVALIVVGQEYVTAGVPVAPTYREATQ
ncbi:MAG: efflux RND transporter periplasmic adaptor subunit [Pseudomonadota bacterium]